MQFHSMHSTALSGTEHIVPQHSTAYVARNTVPQHSAALSGTEHIVPQHAQNSFKWQFHSTAQL